MMRTQSFLIFILPLVLFCGCAQALHNVPVSLNQKVQPADLKTLSEKQENCDTYNDTAFTSSEDDMQLIINEALYYCETSQGLREKGSIKSALEKLDHAYSLILVIDTNKVPELIQQKEDIRFMISKRVLNMLLSKRRSRFVRRCRNKNTIRKRPMWLPRMTSLKLFRGGNRSRS
jgi:hypothetical protein